MNTIMEWFCRNGVAANLILVIIAVGGILTVKERLVIEVFPDFAQDAVSIRVVYPGAAPEEVEEGICIRIEEQIQDVLGIDQIQSVASEGTGTVIVKAIAGYDPRRLLDDVKARVDAIDTFPEEAERPVVEEVLLRNQVINVTVSGEVGEANLKRWGERIRSDLLALPEISQVELDSVRPYEVAIEVSEDTLRKHELTFDEVARAVREFSLDIPGGTIRTEGGEVMVRTIGQAYRGADFEAIVLLRGEDGVRVTLGEVARVRDGFAESDQTARFNGQPAVLVRVFRVGNENAIEVADTVKRYVEEMQDQLPSSLALTTWQDDSSYLESRLGLLLRNAAIGLVLVFLTLALFLRFQLAIWVTVGIPVSFLGALCLLPELGVTINMISLFAFILVLGIVVDDAIVVGENIYSHYQRGKPALQAAIDGAREVAVPVVFAVLTTVAAFLPMLMVPGATGRIWAVIPLVVIPTLLFSLVESHLVLPNHLSYMVPRKQQRPGWNPVRLWERLQRRVADGLDRFIEGAYKPFLEKALRYRYLTLCGFLAAIVVTAGLVQSGWVRFIFFPNVEADFVIATVTMPEGTPVEVTGGAVQRVERAALELREELDAEHGIGNSIIHFLTSLGEQPLGDQLGGAMGTGERGGGSHIAEVVIELAPSEVRGIRSSEVERRWREKVGDIPGIRELMFHSSLVGMQKPVDLRLSGPDFQEVLEVTERMKEELGAVEGVLEIADSHQAGKREVQLELKPGAELLGISLSEVGRQVRQAFHGEEAQRFLRGREEVKVMVRYPEEQRRSVADLEEMNLRLPDGTEVPFSSVAVARPGLGFSSIRRVDGRRAVNVTADVDTSLTTADQVFDRLNREVFPRLQAAHPRIEIVAEGQRQDQADSIGGLIQGGIFAIFLIYALLAVPFRSYTQPLLVMSVIPFGLVGAVAGHLIMGLPMSILSVCGMVALAGVVVNDSLVLVDYINRRRRSGLSMMRAAREAGRARFRPVLLTSLTTFAGLSPLIFERSAQAQFLIPMAVSLAYGILFATAITLVLLPSLYLMMEDGKVFLIRRLGFRRLRRARVPGAWRG